MLLLNSQKMGEMSQSMHRMRYSLLLLLEMVQVNELKPVEDAENLRHQQRGFQPPFFFSPMVGIRAGARQMLLQSTTDDGRVSHRPGKPKGRGEIPLLADILLYTDSKETQKRM